jgi:CheY-like chemotaxis protein
LQRFSWGRFLLSPIGTVAGVMGRWRAGELSARTKMTPTDEVHAVGAALDSLLDELDCRRVQNERAEEERMLLVRELAHRVKNGFTLVQAIARRASGKANPDAYHSFASRLSSLASTYDLLLSKDASASTVREVIETALRAHAGDDHERLHLNGPDVTLPADLALPLSLVITSWRRTRQSMGALEMRGWQGRDRVDLRKGEFPPPLDGNRRATCLAADPQGIWIRFDRARIPRVGEGALQAGLPTRRPSVRSCVYGGTLSFRHGSFGKRGQLVTAGRTKILVVEDEPLLLMMAVEIVKDAGFEAIEASDAHQALAFLESDPDIIILWTDIDMPGSMDGLKLAAAVRDRWPPIEILIVSGKQRPNSDELPERGVFIPKPYDSRKVTQTLVRMAA